MVRGVFRGFLGLFLLSFVSATEVIHLPQTHSLPDTDYSKPENYFDIARSQHEISLALIREKAEYGMTEHVLEDFAQSIPEAKELFPQGIPLHFDSLSEKQRIFLAKHGALPTLLSLGYVKEVWGASTHEHWAYGDTLSEECQKAWATPELGNRENLLQCTSRLEKYSFFEREHFALNRIKEFVKKLETENRVFLVYGSQHDFLRHQAMFSNLKIRRYKLDHDSGPGRYFGPIPEWGYTNVMTPDDQIRFYALIVREHPEFSPADLLFAEEQQLEILQMFKRLGLNISEETSEYLLSDNLKTVAISSLISRN